MGLAERRRIAEIKTTTTAQTETAKSELGLPIDFDTTTLIEEAGVLDGYDYYKTYCVPMVINVFKEIMSDDMGKSAVKEKIKAVKIINTSKSTTEGGAKGLELKEGELIIKMGFYQYSDILWDEADLKTKIENML